MKTKLLFTLIVFWGFLFSANAQYQQLDAYITQGLESNLELKQKKATYQKSIQALRRAKALYFPQLALKARYTVANGGRQIDFPVGDLLNPVYSTLNLLTQSYPPQMQFPEKQIENETFDFYRPTEHETKLELVQPLFNPQIYFNHQIKQQMVQAQSYDLQAFQRKLVYEIKAAYFQFLTVQEIEKLLAEAKKLAQENLRVSRSLHKNAKVSIDHVYRAEAEVAKIEQKQAQAEQQHHTAQAWFNFLLNRKTQSPVQAPDSLVLPALPLALSNANQQATSQREELNRLETYRKASEINLKRLKSNALPTLAAVVDYGFQGTEYKFSHEHDFVLASLVLQWDLFKGFENKAKIQEVIIENQRLAYKHSEAERRIELETLNAFYALQAAQKAIVAAQKQAQSAKNAYRIVNKKYAQGQAPQIELIDAQTELSSARQNLAIVKYEYLIKHADFERITASFDLPAATLSE